MTDYYKVLGIAVSATPKQIKDAFRILALKLHPDKNISNNIAEKLQQQEKFRKVSEAYQTLKDAEKRREYDKQYSLQKGYYNFTGANDNASGFSTQQSRTNTEFHPGGSRHFKYKDHEHVFIPKDHFNIHEWNAAHYGEDATSPVGPNAKNYTGTGRSGSAWMNMPGNSHQDYFRKKASREQQRASGVGKRGTSEASANATNAEQKKKQWSDAANNLHRQREQRRQGQTTRMQNEPEGCSIS